MMRAPVRELTQSRREMPGLCDTKKSCIPGGPQTSLMSAHLQSQALYIPPPLSAVVGSHCTGCELNAAVYGRNIDGQLSWMSNHLQTSSGLVPARAADYSIYTIIGLCNLEDCYAGYDL